MFKFFKNKTFLKSIVSLAIPIALQNLVMALLNIFDQVMVGWLPKEIADLALSAVLLANQVVFIFQIIHSAACNTTNIFIAQYTESGQKHLIPQRIGLVLSINVTLSVIFTVVCAICPEAVLSIFSPDPDYAQMAADFLRVVSFSFVPTAITMTLSFSMRALKKLKIPLMSSIIGVALNVVLNYVFMFGLGSFKGMGLLGAAYGTIVSRAIELAILLTCLIVKKAEVFAPLKVMLKVDPQFLKVFFKNFFPILCNEVFWVLSSTAFLFVYDKLPSSEVALASTNIANAVDKIISVAMLGVGAAIGILMSNVLATGDRKAIQEYKSMSIGFSIMTGMMIALITVGAAFGAPYCFKNISQATHETSTKLLCLYALFAPFRTLNFALIVGILRSGGDNTFCVLCETPTIWLVSVPLVFVGGLVFQLNILWLYVLASVCEVLKSIIFYLRSCGTKWIKLCGPTPTPAPADGAEIPLDTPPAAEPTQQNEHNELLACAQADEPSNDAENNAKDA